MRNPLKFPYRGNYDGQRFDIRRGGEQLVRIFSSYREGQAYALGLAHWLDRATQMYLQRIVIRGRVSELLEDSEENLKLDLYMRRMEFFYLAKIERESLGGEAKNYLQAYCRGVNKAMEYHWPWEFKLARLPREPWDPADTLALIKASSFLGLAQSQQEMEKFIIQSLQAGISKEFLQQLFTPHLNSWDSRIEEIIGQLKIFHRPVPLTPLIPPSLKASNNWVIAGKKSSSGNPLVGADPHLDIQRLPASWYEVKIHSEDHFAYGITMPGIPGLVMGRSKELSFNLTYGFMDTLDYFVEDIEEEKFRREEGPYKELNTRREKIKRKHHPYENLVVKKTECGRLECPDHYPEGGTLPALEDGHYLSFAWTGDRRGEVAQAIPILMNISQCKTVSEAQELSSSLFMSCNWLFSDHLGNIGYQQSGHLPVRKGSGLLPRISWDRENHWQGVHPPHQLGRFTNPKEGLLATANNDMNKENGPVSINLSAGEYRFQRIYQEISGRERWSVEDIKSLQSDVISLHALQYMDKIKGLIPDTPSGRILSAWNGSYHVDSLGAFLFEKFYRQLLDNTFGKHIFGPSTWEAFCDQTSFFTFYHYLLDRFFLEMSEQRWNDFFSFERTVAFKKSLEQTLEKCPTGKLRTWGKENSFFMEHIFFQNRYPSLCKLLGLRKGPFPLPGCRATISQGAIYRQGTRQDSAAPSWRFVSDMGKDFSFTVLPGGIRDRAFSRYYANELSQWLNFQYKIILPD